jgi:hypothetical protein
MDAPWPDDGTTIEEHVALVDNTRCFIEELKLGTQRRLRGFNHISRSVMEKLNQCAIWAESVTVHQRLLRMGEDERQQYMQILQILRLSAERLSLLMGIDCTRSSVFSVDGAGPLEEFDFRGVTLEMLVILRPDDPDGSCVVMSINRICDSLRQASDMLWLLCEPDHRQVRMGLNHAHGCLTDDSEIYSDLYDYFVDAAGSIEALETRPARLRCAYGMVDLADRRVRGRLPVAIKVAIAGYCV